MRIVSKRVFVVWLCAMLGLSFLATVPVSAQEKIVVRVGHQEPPDSSNDQDCKFFGELVRLKSGGRIEVKVFAASLLGKGVSMLEAVQAGSQEITFQVSPVIGLVKEDRYWDLPYLFPDRDAVTKLTSSPLRKQMEENYLKKGLVLLGYYDLGYRHVSNNKRPIFLPSDLKGLKIRVAAGPTKIMVWKAFGASPTPLAYAEAYQALKQGVVDGLDSVLVGYYYAKFYEVQKYLSLTGQVYNPQIMVAGKPFWDRTPDWARKILKEAAEEGAIAARYKAETLDVVLTEKLKQLGMQINTLTPEQRKVWRKAAQPVYDELSKDIGKEFLQKIMDIVGS